MTARVRAAFSTRDNGDLRHDLVARERFGRLTGATTPWATVHQVHGARVVEVSAAGEFGDADGMVTATPGVPVAVFTADCLGIVIDAAPVVAVVHGGWRGLDAGVIENALDAIRQMGGRTRSAWIGPSIGPCCCEGGEEVAQRVPGHVTQTTWGTTAIDLRAVAEARLGIEAIIDERCTRCGPGLFSHRSDGTSARLVAVGWLEE